MKGLKKNLCQSEARTTVINLVLAGYFSVTSLYSQVASADVQVESKLLKSLTLSAPAPTTQIGKDLVFSSGYELYFYDIESTNFTKVDKKPLNLKTLGTNVQIQRFMGGYGHKKLILSVAPTAKDGTPTEQAKLILYDPLTRKIHPLGKNLVSCVEVGGETYCDPIQYDQVAVQEKRIFINAGGCNTVRYSDDLGETWHIVLGDAGDGGGNYTGYFGFKKGYLLSGGECPLDSAFIAVYSANNNWTKILETKPIKQIDIKFLSNRRIYFFKEIKTSGRVFAGAEGALIELVGDSFEPRYRIQFEQSETSTETALYPYFFGVIQNEDSPNILLSFGTQHNGTSTIMFSKDGGTLWEDITAKVLPDRKKYSVTNIVFDNKNKRFILTAIEQSDVASPQRKILIYETKLLKPPE